MTLRASRIVDFVIKYRLLYFNANGRKPGDNIYHQHLYCVHLDGSGLTLLDPCAANHNSVLSPTKQFLVDNSSAVDRAPVSVLRDVQGKQLMVLGECDLSRLQEIGWKIPETFMVKAADGMTDLYGNMWKPFDFDPKKKYPIIANVYPGPQMEGVNGTSRRSVRRAGPARLLVIQVGHRGARRTVPPTSGSTTNLRLWLADRRHRTTGGRFPFIDIVASASMAIRAVASVRRAMLQKHNEFFKAAVASSGNHDSNIYNVPGPSTITASRKGHQAGRYQQEGR